MLTAPWAARLDTLIDELASAPTQPGLSNPYRCPTARHNLYTYLARCMHARLMLIGEAPGYRGAAITGVPFTAVSTLLLDWGDPWNAFGVGAGYSVCGIVAYRREATATIVWNTLAELTPKHLPALWNAVPFHPKSDRGTNSTLTASDLSLGLPFLEEMLALFSDATVLAVGRVAGAALSKLGHPYEPIRHPSHGGKAAFRSGLHRVTSAYQAAGCTPCFESRGSP